MREHVQTTGVRKYAGDDLIELQAEPLAAIQGFFEAYGNCIVQGCEVVAAGNAYNVTTGLLALSGMDAAGEVTFKVVPFSGVENVTLPLYFTLSHSVVERAYADGKVKPIAYDYRAAVSAVKPAEGVSFLELTAAGGRRFVDAVKITEKLDKTGNGRDVIVTFSQSANRENIASGERLGGMFGKVVKWFSDLKAVAFSGKMSDLTDDATHRFVSDVEKQSWHDKYTRIETYTRAETDTRDAAALQSAKEYAAAKIAEIVNSAPSTLDTLQELAAALGNDPNFATSIMALIAGKADTVHAHTTSQITDFPTALPANGGNADTVGGLHASDFPVVNEAAIQNLNNLNGFGIMCNPLTSYATPENNYPINEAGTLFYGTAAYESANQIYGSFINNRWFVRGSGGGKDLKTPWKELATIDVIPTSLPANGGNADTVSGSPAWRLQSVKTDNVPYGANAYDVQSRYNAKGDGKFRLEIVGMPDASIYTDGVSVGHADVANNADTLDGLHAAAVGQVEASKLASYDVNGYMNARLFRDNWGVDNALPIGFVCFKTTLEDGYHLFCSLERFKQVLGTFITNRGTLVADELNTFTNRESGTYSVLLPGAVHSLIVFKSTGSTSAVEILSGYEEDARLQVRKTIDSNRQTNFKELAWLTDIPTTTAQIADTAGRRYVTEYEKSLWSGKASAIHAHSEYALTNHAHSGYATTDHVHAMTTVLSAMYEFPWNSKNNSVDMNSVMGLWILIDVTRNSVGRFTVRHSLGHKKYTLILTGGGRPGDSAAIISVALIAREANYFTVQTSVGDQFHDGGFYATILTF